MKTLKRQQGMTGISWLIVLGMIAFFVSLGLRLFPIYSENFNVVSSLNSLKDEPHITKKSKGDIKRLILNRFQINDVKNAGRNNIEVIKRKGVLTVTVEYDVRTKWFGALSIIVDFDESVEIVSN